MKMEIKISEQNLEDYIVKNIDKYYPNYKLICQQVNLGVGVADIVLFKQFEPKIEKGSQAIPENDVEITHKFNILVLELKIDKAMPIDIGQLARYVIAIGDMVDVEIVSLNHETHVLNFDIEGLLISPDIEFDALAMCLASDNISWQPYVISLENGFELDEKWQSGMADYFNYNAGSSIITQFIKSAMNAFLGLETKLSCWF